MVTPPISDRGRGTGKGADALRYYGSASASTQIKVSTTNAPQVKLANRPYSFSQQVPSLTTKKARTPESAKSTKLSVSRTSSSGSIPSSGPVMKSAWGSDGKAAHPGRPATAAEIVASKPKERVDDASQSPQGPASQDFELLSKLVPRASVVPRNIPGRGAKSTTVLRGTSRVPKPIAPSRSPPTQSMSKLASNTKLKSLSSSSATLEKRRRAYTNNKPGSADDTSPRSLNDAKDPYIADREEGRQSIAELEAEIAGSGRRNANLVSLRGDQREPPPVDQIPLPTSLQSRSPGHVGSLSDGRRKHFPRSTSLAASTFRSKESKGRPSKTTQNSSSSSSGGSNLLTKIAERRKGGGSDVRAAFGRTTSLSKVPPPGLGRAPASAFFSETRGRTSPGSRAGSNNEQSKGRERLSPPIPMKERANVLKEAFQINKRVAHGDEGVPGEELQAHAHRRGAFRRVHSEYNANEKTNSFRRMNGVQVNGTIDSATSSTKEGRGNGEPYVTPRQVKETSVGELPTSNTKYEGGRKLDRVSSFGAIGTPPIVSNRPIGNEVDERISKGTEEYPTHSPYHNLWSEPAYEHQNTVSTPGVTSSPIIGAYHDLNGGAILEDIDSLTLTGTPGLDSMLQHLELRSHTEQHGQNDSNQHSSQPRYYSHF